MLEGPAFNNPHRRKIDRIGMSLTSLFVSPHHRWSQKNLQRDLFACFWMDRQRKIEPNLRILPDHLPDERAGICGALRQSQDG